jgi:hypothetical protein
MQEDFCAAPAVVENDWELPPTSRPHWSGKPLRALLADIWQWPSEIGDVCLDDTHGDIEYRFHKLAKEWSEETRSISSVTALTSHRNYREIVKLGWDVVPYLLIDLQQNRRFWFPALYEITQVRPFDRSDAGNSKRMTEAWVKWGRKKKLIDLCNR